MPLSLLRLQFFLSLGVVFSTLTSCSNLFEIDPEEVLLEKAEIKFYKTQKEAQTMLSLLGAQSALLEAWPTEDSICDSCMVAYRGNSASLGLHFVHPMTQQDIGFWGSIEENTIPGPIWVGVLLIGLDVAWPNQIWVWPEQLEDGSLLGVSRELVDSGDDKKIVLGTILKQMIQIGSEYGERMRAAEEVAPFDLSGAAVQYLQPYQSAVDQVKAERLCSPLFGVSPVPNAVPFSNQGIGTVDLLVCSDPQSDLFVAPGHVSWLGDPELYNLINIRNIGPSTVEVRLFPFDNNFLAPPLKIPAGHVGRLPIPLEFNSRIENDSQVHLLFNPDDRKDESTYVWLH